MHIHTKMILHFTVTKLCWVYPTH